MRPGSEAYLQAVRQAYTVNHWTTSVPVLLDYLGNSAREIAEREAMVDECAIAARAAGASWAEIGGALGISKQAAFGRYGRGGE